MAFGYPQYPGYPMQCYPQPVPDQMAQMRQQMQQPVMQGPQMPPANQIPQPPLQNGGINWVGSKMEADNWPIAPGCAVALWDSNAPVIYLRQADSTGKPSTKVYDLVERDSQPAQRPAPQIDLSQFVTREQLEEILAERLKRPSKAAQKKEDTENG